MTKRFIYGASGVVEYWLVDSAGFIERWSGPSLSSEELVAEILTSPLLPGFELDVGKLLAHVV